jgi:hypothetical protein
MVSNGFEAYVYLGAIRAARLDLAAESIDTLPVNV